MRKRQKKKNKKNLWHNIMYKHCFGCNTPKERKTFTKRLKSGEIVIRRKTSAETRESERAIMKRRMAKILSQLPSISGRFKKEQ